MASVTVTARPEAAAPPREDEPRWRLPGSRLGRLIVALNLLGLVILTIGALVQNELSQGLIRAEEESLATQGRGIAHVIEEAATFGDPAPGLDEQRARDTLQVLFIQGSQRARIYDNQGQLIADSYVLNDHIVQEPLPPIEKPGGFHFNWDFLKPKNQPAQAERAHADLAAEVGRALQGQTVHDMRTTEGGQRVVSVSIPIQRVQAVLGVLTLESGDVDQVVADQRRALIPFILIAVAVTLTSSFLLSRLIALPVLRLARAADRVTAQRARAISLPDIAERDDELGDLSRSLETMTQTLSERMDAIEGFAADVAHEIRNPLTSMRSAVETLDLVTDSGARDRLTGILKADVGRLDRLVTDISNASRLDAEMFREAPRPINFGELLRNLVDYYGQAANPGEPPVAYLPPESEAPVMVRVREGPLSQVFRNLIDNARSFTAVSARPNPSVRVTLRRVGRQAIATVEDDGPGLPPENLETVFDRFYTARPKGAAFGVHSGLGLSIARQIVEAHGGKIRAENRTDDTGAVLGARFIVTLADIGG
ncbi:MAG TPA: stimulus-sensing domain-containing protein [Caulobacteraceae bacterium]|nr:stimulus-sensing domain-containing protein [Caulobacteraceae bacterium]